MIPRDFVYTASAIAGAVLAFLLLANLLIIIARWLRIINWPSVIVLRRSLLFRVPRVLVFPCAGHASHCCLLFVVLRWVLRVLSSALCGFCPPGFRRRFVPFCTSRAARSRCFARHCRCSRRAAVSLAPRSSPLLALPCRFSPFCALPRCSLRFPPLLAAHSFRVHPSSFFRVSFPGVVPLFVLAFPLSPRPSSFPSLCFALPLCFFPPFSRCPARLFLPSPFASRRPQSSFCWLPLGSPLLFPSTKFAITSEESEENKSCRRQSA